MSGLRDAADRIAGMGRLPAGNPDRKLASEKAAERLAGRVVRTAGETEPWDAFLVRIGVIGG